MPTPRPTGHASIAPGQAAPMLALLLFAGLLSAPGAVAGRNNRGTIPNGMFKNTVALDGWDHTVLYSKAQPLPKGAARAAGHPDTADLELLCSKQNGAIDGHCLERLPDEYSQYRALPILKPWGVPLDLLRSSCDQAKMKVSLPFARCHVVSCTSHG